MVIKNDSTVMILKRFLNDGPKGLKGSFFKDLKGSFFKGLKKT